MTTKFPALPLVIDASHRCLSPPIEYCVPQCFVSSARDLASRLAAILDHELITVKRLCGHDTWVGPVAENLATDINGLERRLAILLDEIISHDRSSEHTALS